MSRPPNTQPVPAKVQEYLDFQRTMKSVKNNTSKNQKSALRVMDAWKELSIWTAEDVTQYILYMKDEQYSEFTIQMRKALIKAFFIWAGKDKLVQNIEIKLPKKKLRSGDILTPDDVNKLIDTAEDNQTKALIALLFDSGARISEALRVKVRDLKENDRGLIIPIPATKTGEEDRICLCVLSGQYIRNHILYPTRKADDLIFDFSPVTAWLEVKKLGKKAGINKPISPQKFRHAQATYMVRKGYQESIIRKKLGWTDDSKMISRYTHIDGEDVINATLEKETGGEHVISSELVKAITPATPIAIADPSLEFSRLHNDNEQLRHDYDELKSRTERLEAYLMDLSYWETPNKSVKDSP